MENGSNAWDRPETKEESGTREEPFVMTEAEARELGLVDDMTGRTAE